MLLIIRKLWNMKNAYIRYCVERKRKGKRVEVIDPKLAMFSPWSMDTLWFSLTLWTQWKQCSFSWQLVWRTNKFIGWCRLILNHSVTVSSFRIVFSFLSFFLWLNDSISFLFIVKYSGMFVCLACVCVWDTFTIYDLLSSWFDYQHTNTHANPPHTHTLLFAKTFAHGS